MKHKILIAGLFALATILVSSCAKEQFFDNNDKDYEPEHKSGQVVSLFATTQQVKTVNDGLSTKWVADDALNVFHAEAGKTEYGYNDKFTIDPENIETGRFLGTLTTPLDAEKSYDWYVLYPYNTNIQTPANSSKGYLPIGSSGKSVAQVQNGNNSTAHLGGQYFPLYGKATDVKKGDTPSISMNQALCVVKIQVTNNSTEPFAVTSVSIEANEDITGTYYIDFTGDAPVFTASGYNYVSNIVNLTVNDGEDIAVGGTADFYLAVKPFTAAKGTSLEVTVNGVTKTVSIPDNKDVEFKPGTIKKISYSYAPPAPVSYTLVTSLSDIEEGDYIITNGDYALQNNFTSTPAVVLSSSFGTIEDGVFTTSSTQCVWTLTGDSYESMTIRPYGSETEYLYAINDNSGLKVGTTSDTWRFETNDGATNGFSMKEATNSKYCAVYVDNSSNPKDWRTYTSAQHNNYKLNKGALLLYKVASTDPKIIPGDDIAAPATGVEEGSLEYTVKNFDDDVVPTYTGCVSAAAINTKGTVTYTVSPNYTLGDVEGTITLTSASTGATATVSVSQAASVFVVDADNPIVIGNKSEDKGSFSIKSTFGGSLTISDSDNFLINDTYEANEEGTTVTIVAVNDGAATDREATITVTRPEQDDVVINIKQNKTGAQSLAVPSNIAVTEKSTSGISASWTGDDNATSYDWIISTENTASAAESDPNKKSGNVTETSFTCEESFAVGTYYIYVRSVGDGTSFITSEYGSSAAVEIKEQHTLTLDFEKPAADYKLWEFSNMESQQTHSDVTAYGGSYFGTTGGKATASIQTKEKIADPKSIQFFISKQTTNTTSSSWKVQVSSDKTNWSDIGGSIDATSMTKGTWVEVNREFSSNSNVYVRILYSNSTAYRCIDDVVLTYEGAEIKGPELTSIAVKTSSHRTFTQGDDFVKETIEATYSDASTSDVTANATFSGYDMSSTGEQTVSVSYTEDGVTKYTSYSITVNAAAALDHITVSSEHRTFSKGADFEEETVTAHYTDGSSRVVSGATFSGYDMSATGEQTVNVSYTELSVTKETSYTITVTDAPKSWTYAVEQNSPTLNSSNPATVNGATWSIVMGTKVGSPSANGAPAKYSGIYGWKWGSSKSAYWASYTLSTDYFSSKKVKSVTVNFLNNGTKMGTMVVTQGTTTIGTTSNEFGTSWTDLTANTNQGTSGALSIQYSVDQASYIHSITVEYFD